MSKAGLLRRSFKRIARLFAGEKPRVLMWDAVYPRTDENAGAINIVSNIRIFIDLGCDVVFATSEAATKGIDARERLEALGATCVGPEQYSSFGKLVEREGSRFAICFLSRVVTGGLLFETARRHCNNARIIFNLSDVHHLRRMRRAKLEKAEGDETLMNVIAELKRRELELVRAADASIVVSSVEKKLLDEAVPGARVWHIPLIYDIPGRAGPFRGRSGIGFVAGFAWEPNRNAARYFLTNIWPLVRARLPDAKFFLIGSNLPDELAKSSEPGVIPIGYVPSISSALAKLRLTVAPLRFGSGAKGKVVTTLAHGVPCVASEIAAEGMDLVDGRHVLIGRDPTHFAEQIVRLYEDEALWNSLSDAGLEIARKNHSYENGREQMRALLAEIGVL